MRSLLRLACALPLLCSLATVGPARAEDVSGRFGLGLEAAAMKLTGGEHDYSDVNPNYALHLRYGLSPTLSVEGAFKTLWSRPAVSAPDEDAGFSWKATRDIYTTIWELRAGLLYHFLPEKAASPFLGLDLGVAGFRVKDMRNQDGFGGLFPGGSILEGYDEDGKLKQLSSTQFTSVFTGGLEWFLAPRFSLWLGGRYHLFP
ncbi:outer membrane beta-barrel protein, partial [bacterium]|nr:outer membrane beta-barrel protein [bacterium]